MVYLLATEYITYRSNYFVVKKYLTYSSLHGDRIANIIIYADGIANT